jgi:hypothetical protein
VVGAQIISRGKGGMSLRGLIILLTTIPSLAFASEPLTSREMRALSAREANKQVREDLLSILKPMGKVGHGMRRQVGDLWMHTQPYGTEYKGLCRRDTVSLYYAPTDKTPEYEDQPVRPYRIEAESSYAFVSHPKPEYLADDDERRSPFQSECARATKEEWAGWFTANDPRLALLGTLAMQAGVEWAQMPGHELKSCTKDKQGKSLNCANELISSAKVENLESISTCDADKDQVCYTIVAGSFEMTIKAKKKSDIITADDIISVDGGFQIIVT